MTEKKVDSRRSQSEFFWFLFQITALSATLLIPLYNDMKEESSGLSMLELSGAQKQISLGRAVVETARASVNDTMSSQVLPLPAYPQLIEPQKLRFQVQQRQIRFEEERLLRRDPATSTPNENWRLSRVLKRSKKAASLGFASELELPLIDNSGLGLPSSTVYFELDDGENEFEVIYLDQRGKEHRFTVYVEQIKKSNS